MTTNFTQLIDYHSFIWIRQDEEVVWLLYDGYEIPEVISNLCNPGLYEGTKYICLYTLDMISQCRGLFNAFEPSSNETYYVCDALLKAIY